MSEELSRLRWQCRRGMLELDLLFQGYLDNGYSKADPEEQAAFKELLSFPDQQLQDLLLGDEVHDEARIAHVIDIIKNQSADH